MGNLFSSEKSTKKTKTVKKKLLVKKPKICKKMKGGDPLQILKGDIIFFYARAIINGKHKNTDDVHRCIKLKARVVDINNTSFKVYVPHILYANCSKKYYKKSNPSVSSLDIMISMNGVYGLTKSSNLYGKSFEDDKKGFANATFPSIYSCTKHEIEIGGTFNDYTLTNNNKPCIPKYSC